MLRFSVFQFADKIAKFNSVFSIPGRAYRLTLAFWYLDHKEFEVRVKIKYFYLEFSQTMTSYFNYLQLQRFIIVV